MFQTWSFCCWHCPTQNRGKIQLAKNIRLKILVFFFKRKKFKNYFCFLCKKDNAGQTGAYVRVRLGFHVCMVIFHFLAICDDDYCNFFDERVFIQTLEVCLLEVERQFRCCCCLFVSFLLTLISCVVNLLSKPA